MKQLKKLDNVPPIASVSLFKQVLTTEEQVAEFKKAAIQELQQKRWQQLQISVQNIEQYFGFQSDPNAWSWLPKRFRDEFNHQGIHVHKARGRTYATITIDEAEKK